MKLRRSPKKRIQENILAVGLALVLSFFVYQIVQNSGMITADITGGPGPVFNEYSDIVVYYNPVHENLEIFAGKIMKDIESMSIVFVFDPDVVTLSSDDFRSAYTLSYSSAGTGKGMVVLTDFSDVLQIHDTLLTFSVAGRADAIVVADVVAIFKDGSQASLAVQLPH